jgi:hypothetical protein
MLPEGSIVKLVAGSLADSRMVDVISDGGTLAVFAGDLFQRGRKVVRFGWIRSHETSSRAYHDVSQGLLGSIFSMAGGFDLRIKSDIIAVCDSVKFSDCARRYSATAAVNSAMSRWFSAQNNATGSPQAFAVAVAPTRTIRTARRRGRVGVRASANRPAAPGGRAHSAAVQVS